MKKAVFSLLFLLTSLAIPVQVSAVDLYGQACSGHNTAASAVCVDNKTGNPLVGPNGLLVKVTQLIALVAGIAAVIVIIISGIRFITSAGDSKGVSSARQSILYALSGLAVIVLAQSIIVFVIKKF